MAIRTHGLSVRRLVVPPICALALTACSYAKPNTTPPNFTGLGGPGDTTIIRAGGEDSGVIFTFPRHRARRNGGAFEIGVNPFLWRGALLTIGSLPLVSADPFGGVIITDWYSPANAPDERFKQNVFILSRDLRGDAIRVNVFHQVIRGGRWVDSPVSPAIQTDIQNRVLDEARRLQVTGQG